MVHGNSFERVSGRGNRVQDSSWPLTTISESLAFWTSRNVILDVSVHAGPRMGFQVPDSLGHSGVAGEYMIVGQLQLDYSILRIFEETSYSFLGRIRHPQLLQKQGNDLVLLEIFWINYRGA